MASINMDIPCQQDQNQIPLNNFLKNDGNDIVRPNFFNNINQDVIINGKSIIAESNDSRNFSKDDRDEYSSPLRDRKIREVMSEFNLLVERNRFCSYSDMCYEEKVSQWRQWCIDSECNMDLFQSCYFLCDRLKIPLTPVIIDEIRSMQCLQDNGEFNIKFFKDICVNYLKEKCCSQDRVIPETFQGNTSYVSQNDKEWPEWRINGEFNQKFYDIIHMYCIVKNIPVRREFIRGVLEDYCVSDNQFDFNSFYRFIAIYITTKHQDQCFDNDEIENVIDWPELHVNHQYDKKLFDHVVIFFNALGLKFVRENVFLLRSMIIFNYQRVFNLDLFCQCSIACQDSKRKIKVGDDLMYFLTDCLIQYLGLSFSQDETGVSALCLDENSEICSPEATPNSLQKNISQHISQSDKNWQEWKINGEFNQQFYVNIHLHCIINNQPVTKEFIKTIILSYSTENNQFDLNKYCEEISLYLTCVEEPYVAIEERSNNTLDWPEFYINNEYSERFFKHIFDCIALIQCSFKREVVHQFRYMKMFNYQGKFNLDLFCQFTKGCQNHKDVIKSPDDFLKILEKLFIEYLGLSDLQYETDLDSLHLDRDRDEERCGSKVVSQPLLGSQNEIGASVLQVDVDSEMNRLEDVSKQSQESLSHHIPQSDKNWPEWKINGEFNQKFYNYIHMFCIVQYENVTQIFIKDIIKRFRTCDDHFDLDSFYRCVERELTSTPDISFPDSDIEDPEACPEFRINNKYDDRLFQNTCIFLSALKLSSLRRHAVYGFRGMIMFNYKGEFNLDLFCQCAISVQKEESRLASCTDKTAILFECFTKKFAQYLGLSDSQNEQESSSHIPQSDKDWPEWKINGEFNQQLYDYVHLYFDTLKCPITQSLVHDLLNQRMGMSDSPFDVNKFCLAIEMFISSSGNNPVNWLELYINGQYSEKLFDNFFKLFAILHIPVTSFFIASFRSINVLNDEDGFNVDLFYRWVITCEDNKDKIYSIDDALELLKKLVPEDRVIDSPILSKIREFSNLLYLQNQGIFSPLENGGSLISSFISSIQTAQDNASYIPQSDKEWEEWKIDGQFNQKFYTYFHMIAFMQRINVDTINVREVIVSYRTSQDQFDLDRFCGLVEKYMTMVPDQEFCDSEIDNIKNWPELCINNEYNDELFSCCLIFCGYLVKKNSLTRRDVYTLRGMRIFNFQGEFNLDLFRLCAITCKNNENILNEHGLPDRKKIFNLFIACFAAYYGFSDSQNEKDLFIFQVNRENGDCRSAATLKIPQESTSCILQSDKSWPEWEIDGQFNQKFFDYVHILCNMKKLNIRREAIHMLRSMECFKMNGQFSLDLFISFVEQAKTIYSQLQQDSVQIMTNLVDHQSQINSSELTTAEFMPLQSQSNPIELMMRVMENHQSKPNEMNEL